MKQFIKDSINLIFNNKTAYEAFELIPEDIMVWLKQRFNFRGVVNIYFTEDYLCIVGLPQQVDSFLYYIGEEDNKNLIGCTRVGQEQVTILAEGQAQYILDAILDSLEG